MFTWLWLYEHYLQMGHKIYYDVLYTFWFFSFVCVCELIPHGCLFYLKCSSNCVNPSICSNTLGIMLISSSWRNRSRSLLNGSDLRWFCCRATAQLLSWDFASHHLPLCISLIRNPMSSSFLVYFLYWWSIYLPSLNDFILLSYLIGSLADIEFQAQSIFSHKVFFFYLLASTKHPLLWVSTLPGDLQCFSIKSISALPH